MWCLHVQGAVKLSIQVPQDSENATWKLEGQTVNVEVDIKDTVRTLKQKLMVRWLAGSFHCCCIYIDSSTSYFCRTCWAACL